MTNQGEPGLRRERIEHVIVLMMENRSFDHLLGYLEHPDEDYPNLDRIRPSCPENPARPNRNRVPTTPTATAVLGTDPDHSHEAVMLQMFGRRGTPGRGTPSMTGFVESYRWQVAHGTIKKQSTFERIVAAVLELVSALWSWLTRRRRPIAAKAAEIMECFPESEIPVLAHLAKEYAVFVNWHASVPGETWPNRNFAHAATSHGTANIEIGFYYDDTIFERLTGAEQPWAIYHDGVAQVWVYPDLWLGGTEHFHDMDQLFDDIEADALPAYAFVEPNHGYGEGEGNSQHPGNNTTSNESFVAGEALMARIHDALVAKPEVFARTLFLITYDEHGGFFDHVPPQRVVPPDALRDDTGFDFSHTGVRVPAVAISPLIPRGTIDDTFYEHASIPATVRRQFAPQVDHLSERDKAANDVLEHLRLLPAARTDLTPIRQPGLVAAETGAADAGVTGAADAGVTGAAEARVAGAGEAGVTVAGESGTSPRLNEFQASLVELAGAVKTVIDQRALVERAGPPPFVPDPRTKAAAQARVLVPGSPAAEAVDEVVAHFVSPGPTRDTAGIDAGNEPR